MTASTRALDQLGQTGAWLARWDDLRNAADLIAQGRMVAAEGDSWRVQRQGMDIVVTLFGVGRTS